MEQSNGHQKASPPVSKLAALKTTPKLSLTPDPSAATHHLQTAQKKDDRPTTVEEIPPPSYLSASSVGSQVDDRPPSEPLTVERLRIYWLKYAESIRAQKPFVHNAMTRHEIELQNGNEIVIKLSNPTLEETLMREAMPGIGAYLRQNFQMSFQLVVEAASQVETTTRQLYTASDKFSHLAAQHPLLNELKSLFGLDMEF